MTSNRVFMYPSCNEDVSTLSGVRDAVRNEASEIYFKAEGILAGHRKTGNARIEISDTMYYSHWGVTVSMIDERAANAGGPGALSIEFGHFIKTGSGGERFVDGLYVMSRGAGLM